MNEKEMTESLKKGNIAAYRQLFIQYYTTIQRFLNKFVGSNDVASDITQDIFMKVWINRQRLDPNKSIKSYLYVLAKNEALNHMKRASLTADKLTYDSLISNDNIEQHVEYIELRTVLENRIVAMPPQRRLIFRMSRYSQLSNQEIAEKLNISVRTVEKHLELAKKDLENIKPA